VLAPTTAEELAETLRRLASANRTITLEGHGSKRRMGGFIHPSDETVSLGGLARVLQYEPHDLTISVEAGLPWSDLTARLAVHRQMVPLDPPFADSATVGGVVAANCSGPRRRLYGSARDLVIGMRFATLEGALVDTGGMVVKNVAGLDMAKLMIGSFGTLAAIAVVNFKLLPQPAAERSFLLTFDSASAAMEARARITSGALEPAALDLLNPHASAVLGNPAWMLAVRASGNLAAVDRYEKELAGLGSGVAFDEDRHTILWRRIQEFTPRFLADRPDGAVVRASCTLKEVAEVMERFSGPAIARAASGVCYGYFERSRDAAAWVAEAAARGSTAVIEFGPEARSNLVLWPAPSGDLELMRRVKQMFDPSNLLNRGRLYQRI
jgi:glycolate oxidase FAD binding subunit